MNVIGISYGYHMDVISSSIKLLNPTKLGMNQISRQKSCFPWLLPKLLLVGFCINSSYFEIFEDEIE